MNGGQGPTFRDVMGLALPIAGLTVGLVRPQAGQQFSTLAQLMEMDQRRKERQAEQEREQAAQGALAGQLSPLGFKTDPRLPATTQIGLANVQAADARLRAERERQNVEERRKAQERRGFSEMARIGAASTELPDVNVEQLQALPGQFEFTPEMFQAQERALSRQEERGSRLAKARALEPQFGQTRDVSLAPPSPLREKLEIPATSPFSDRPVIEAAAQGAQLVEPLPPPAPLSIREVPENVHALQRYIMQTGKEPGALEAETQFGVPAVQLPGGREALAGIRQKEAEARRTEAQATALEVGAPFEHEMRLLQLDKLRQEVQQGKMPPLTGDIVNRLRAMPGVDPRNPTPQQVQAAIAAHEQALLGRAVDAAKAQGLAASQLPARTPAEQMQRLQDIALARSAMGELSRLAPTVGLEGLVGGIRPWVNQILQTGIAGPIPIPSSGSFTPEQNRFLALVQDYADSVLRLRSGAQINEQEFQRMLRFLMQPGVTSDVFVARMELQSDLLGVRERVLRDTLTQAGYRAPNILPPPMAPAGGGQRPKSTGAAQPVR